MKPKSDAHSGTELLSGASATELVARATRIPMTDEAVLELLRSRIGGHAYLEPFIPSARERGARRMHYAHLAEGERVLALWDASAMASGEEGFVVTSRRLCWKNPGETARMVEWHDIDAEAIYADSSKVFLGNDVVLLGEDVARVDACADLFYVLALSARPHVPASPSSSGVVPAMAAVEAPHVHMKTTAPPPAGVSYMAYVEHASSQPPPSWCCWKCRTPLFRTTPQCARCGARPAAFGWLRTG
ncbi:MAG TPA: hypothetical protein VIF62_28435 [Labilithrix sp.]|jgi:hypothetical protein